MRQGAVVILMRPGDGAVAMMHRDNKEGIDQPGCWALLAGGTEDGENPRQTAWREVFEEAGYVTDKLTYLFTEPQAKKNGETVERHVFLAWWDGKQPLKKGSEGQEVRFVQREEFGELNIFKDHLDFISRAKEMMGGQIERK